MRESEKWRLVAQRVAEGEPFSQAVWWMFGESFVTTRGSDWSPWEDEEYNYTTLASLYALLLAEEAEDEENAVPRTCFGNEPFTSMNPTSSTATAATYLINYCAEEPPMPVVFVGPEPEQEEPEVALGNYPVDRRKSWNEKLADGLRKWADTVEGW